MEGARILGDGFKLSSECAERAPINGMRVSYTVNIWASCVDSMMNHVR
jgi:hypothetical protein